MLGNVIEVCFDESGNFESICVSVIEHSLSLWPMGQLLGRKGNGRLVIGTERKNFLYHHQKHKGDDGMLEVAELIMRYVVKIN